MKVPRAVNGWTFIEPKRTIHKSCAVRSDSSGSKHRGCRQFADCNADVATVLWGWNLLRVRLTFLLANEIRPISPTGFSSSFSSCSLFGFSLRLLFSPFSLWLSTTAFLASQRLCLCVASCFGCRWYCLIKILSIIIDDESADNFARFRSAALTAFGRPSPLICGRTFCLSLTDLLR